MGNQVGFKTALTNETLNRLRGAGVEHWVLINPSKRKPTHSQTARKSVCLGQSEQQEQEDEAVEQETGHRSTPEHTGPVGDHGVE